MHNLYDINDINDASAIPHCDIYNRRINFIEVKTCTDMHKSKHACTGKLACLYAPQTAGRVAALACKPDIAACDNNMFFIAGLVGPDARTGSVKVGKAADLALIEGDPSTHIGDLRQTRIVMLDGKLLDADALRRAAGFSGRPK